MLKQFLGWYKLTQASKACLKYWDAVSAELTEAFYRMKDKPIGYQSKFFAEKMALRFFEITRKQVTNLTVKAPR